MVMIIAHVFEDFTTGLPILQDFTGDYHILERWSLAGRKIANRVYIQALSHGQFPGTDAFYPIPNELTGESSTKYAPPSGRSFEGAFIMASQDRLKNGGKRDKEGPEVSLIGVFVNGSFVMMIPFKHDLHYVLFEPLRFPMGAEIEFKLRPCSTRTRVAILVGGYLVNGITER